MKGAVPKGEVCMEGSADVHPEPAQRNTVCFDCQLEHGKGLHGEPAHYTFADRTASPSV